VETYGSMDYREKIEFILYQMRLLIRKEDWVRLMIVSRKINTKYLEVADLEDLTIIYNSYLYILHREEMEYLPAARVLKKIGDLLKGGSVRVQAMTAVDFGFRLDKDFVLTNSVFFSITAEYSQEKVKLLNDWKNDYQEYLVRNPVINRLVTTCLSNDLISCNLADWGTEQVEIFSPTFVNNQKNLEAFKNQLVQHNLKVVSKFYNTVTIDRLTVLFGITMKEVEVQLCELITSKQISAKIDRPAGIVTFSEKKKEDEILDEWVGDVSKALELIDITAGLIQRVPGMLAGTAVGN
jgi:26S proteasome regulatory subunit N5